jgi:hypothetical protein
MRAAKPPRKRRTTVLATNKVSDDYAVLTLNTAPGKRAADYMRLPCPQCPWRKDIPAGVFPPDAFRHSAKTCEDMSLTTFACHMAGKASPKTCAGFLRSTDAEHNLAMRIQTARGEYDPRQLNRDQRVPTFATYAEMAVANGVPADDPAILETRSMREKMKWKRS